MKKTAIVLLWLCIAITELHSQQNAFMKKYWNYKNRYQKYFVHLGNNAGDGLPIAHRPLRRFSDFQYSTRDWYPKGATDGIADGGINGIKFGDVTADLGDYIAVLATEFKLLKNGGEDTQPVLNELYYAIQAVERSDYFAEDYLSQSAALPNTNGFFMRGDVEKDYHSPWNNEYTQNNSQDGKDTVKGQDSPSSFTGQPQGYLNPHNEMSQDQIIALMLGFAFVKKYVDNIAVQPTAADAPKNLVTQVQDITNRVMDYIQATYYNADYQIQITVPLWTMPPPFNPVEAKYNINLQADLNWAIINPLSGEPVHEMAPQFGSVIAFTYPLCAAAHYITGNSYDLNGTVHCGMFPMPSYPPKLFYSMDVDIPFPVLNTAWNNIPNGIGSALNVASPIGPFACVYYTGWASTAGLIQIPHPVFGHFCVRDWVLTGIAEGSFKKDYNLNLSLSLASMSSANYSNWSHNEIKRLAQDGNMEIFDLIYATLHDVTPLLPKSYYDAILATAPIEGPYSYDTLGDYSFGWSQNSRWSHPYNIALDPGGKNGNDYMWLYNLYRLAFATDVDVASVAYNERQTEPADFYYCPAIIKNTFINSQQWLEVNNSFSINRKFKNYLDFKCGIKEYSSKNTTLGNNYTMKIKTDLVFPKTVYFNVDGGKVEVGESSNNFYDQGNLIMHHGILNFFSGAQLEIFGNGKIIVESANLSLGSFTTTVLHAGAEIIIKAGGILTFGQNAHIIIEDGAKITIENGGKLNYEKDVDLQLKGDNAVLEISGNLDLKNDAVFTFTYPGTNSGYVKFSNVEADIYTPTENIKYGTNSKIFLHGQGKTDKVLEVTQESIYTSGTANGTCAEFRITDGKVEMSTNARLNLDCKVFINNATIASSYAPGTSSARGIDVFGQPSVSISNSDFIGLQKGINGLLFYGGKSLSVPGCSFIQCDRGLNIEGATVYVNACTFIENGIGVKIQNITKPAYIRHSNFTVNDYNTGISASVATGTPLNVWFCNINGGPYEMNELTGINIDGGNLNLKCTNIHYMRYGVKANDNSFVNMSAENGFGYNDLSNNETAIAFQKCDGVNFKNGHNNFSFNPNLLSRYYNPNNTWVTNSCSYCNFNGLPRMSGEFTHPPCFNNGGTLIFECDQNQWNINDVIGPAMSTQTYQATNTYDRYDVGYVCSNNSHVADVIFADPNPSAAQACPPGSSDCVNPPCLAISNIDVSTLRVINTPTFQNQEMDVAINNATDNINETADGNRSTIMLLKEILDYNLTNPTQEEVRVLDYSIRTIQMALANLQLLKTEVSDTIEVESYFTATLQLLDNKIAQAVAENNYYHHVYLMFDKACVQHLHGDRMAAISTIEQIQLFASAEEVDYLAYWHCLYDLENQAITGVITKEEYTNTLEMCAPPQYLRVMNISENQLEREVKHNPYHFNVDNTNSMAQLKFNSQIAENTTISVYDLSGKIVSSQSFDTQKGENNFVINLANLSKSIYVVQFKVNENVCREKVGLY